MTLEKELRIIEGSSDIILLLCKKRSNLDRELENDGQSARMCDNIMFDQIKRPPAARICEFYSPKTIYYPFFPHPLVVLIRRTLHIHNVFRKAMQSDSSMNKFLSRIEYNIIKTPGG